MTDCPHDRDASAAPAPRPWPIVRFVVFESGCVFSVVLIGSAAWPRIPWTGALGFGIAALVLGYWLWLVVELLPGRARG